MKNIAILVSTKGSTLEYLINNLRKDINIKTVIYDRICGAIDIAKKYNIEVTSKISVLDELDIDLVVLCGYLSLVKEELTKKHKIINVHPSILPKYGGRGFYGDKVHKEVIKNNEKISGATVHWVNEFYDRGDIISQCFVKVKNNDFLDLKEKVQKREKRLLKYVIEEILEEI